MDKHVMLRDGIRVAYIRAESCGMQQSNHHPQSKSTLEF